MRKFNSCINFIDPICFMIMPHFFRYMVANFFFLVIGCCCTYSLLNVTSIVIKQGLNLIISKIHCENRNPTLPNFPRRKSSTIFQSKRRPTKLVPRDSVRPEESDLDTPRRLSGELISITDFLSANKVSLAIMQKQLYETSQRGGITSSPVLSHHSRTSKPNAFGPLAIACEKFETSSK